MAFDLQRRPDPDAAPFVQGKLEVSEDWVRLDPGSPHQQPGVDLGPVAQRHTTIDDTLEARVELEVNAPLHEQFTHVLTKLRWDLTEDRRGGVDQDPTLALGAQRRVIAQGILGQVAQLGERLDARVATTNEHECQVPSAPLRIWFHRSRGHQPQQLVAQVESVETPCAAHGMVDQAGDRERAGDGTHADDDVVVLNGEPQASVGCDRGTTICPGRDP